ncbi:hypothetical protein ACOMICROBIO_GDFFDHBD_02522 [Vibrio sp. B1REV9]|nr:hypothetical protein ACOMICROBIO_GDFFDHBD_02522 [Vibrio sp. B1REV9]
MMKSSKRTSVNLNRNTVDMVPPMSSLLFSKWLWLAVGLTVAVFSLLVKLGLWQLERSNEKQKLEQAMLAREDAPYQAISAVLEQNDWREESVNGVKVKTEVVPEPIAVLLLDNQTYKGKVGYLAFQVVSLLQEPTTLTLLELGFVEGKSNRSDLPTIETLKIPQTITGRLYRKSTNPLSTDLMAEMGNPIRIQNLNVNQLSQLLNIELMPTVLQPDNLKAWPYSFPWNPLPLTSEKHFGYAVQWFAMASVFLLITLLIFVRWIRSERSHGGDV